MHILIVDDETLARSRLRALLTEYNSSYQLSEASHAAEAWAQLQIRGGSDIDVVLLDIHMPGQDGLSLAQSIQQLPNPPAIIFVTAYADHAVSAFELDVVDYLTKPVRLLRLQQALAKVNRVSRAPAVAAPQDGEPALVIQERGRTVRIPIPEVLFLKAEQKYVTVRTFARSYILDGSLLDLESRYAEHFMRVHRNTLVARRALRALEKHFDAEEGEGWAVRLQGLAELLPVSRRQVAAVREALLEN